MVKEYLRIGKFRLCTTSSFQKGEVVSLDASHGLGIEKLVSEPDKIPAYIVLMFITWNEDKEDLSYDIVNDRLFTEVDVEDWAIIKNMVEVGSSLVRCQNIFRDC